MASRFYRLELTSSILSQYHNKTVQIIKKDGAVFLVQLISSELDFLKVKNTRGKILSLHLREIDEIWADKPA